MNYNAFLELVKTQNPDMPVKQQQKLASEKNKEFKAKQKESAASKAAISPVVKELKQNKSSDDKLIDITELAAIEKQIRLAKVDRNSIISHGSQIMPEGKIVKQGKEGANTLVTFEDTHGNKLPVNGCFKIFM